MDKIFDVILSIEHGPDKYICTEFSLPAQPWALHDALDKLQTEDRTKITTYIDQYYGYDDLELIFPKNPDLYELNALTLRLPTLDERQCAAFYGLIYMNDGEQGAFTIKQLLDLAASVDCCHVVPDAANDSELGRFYAENGFIPEVDHVPDTVDVGREMTLVNDPGYSLREINLEKKGKTILWTT